MNILYKEYKHLFSKEEFIAIEERIIKPEHVGFDQKEIDWYYQLIEDWFKNPSSYKFNDMDTHLIDSFSILNLDYMNTQRESQLNKHLIISL